MKYITERYDENEIDDEEKEYLYEKYGCEVWLINKICKHNKHAFWCCECRYHS